MLAYFVLVLILAAGDLHCRAPAFSQTGCIFRWRAPGAPRGDVGAAIPIEALQWGILDK